MDGSAFWPTFDGDSPGVLHDGALHLRVGDAADQVFVVVLPAGVQRQHAGRLVAVQRRLEWRRFRLIITTARAD